MGNDTLVEDGVLALGVSWFLPLCMMSLNTWGTEPNSIPVMKALYTEAFKALQHVSVVGIVMKDC